MRAQDSRIQAMAAIKKDNREEVAFQSVFGQAAYGVEDDEESEE